MTNSHVATADLFDEVPEKLQVCRSNFRSYGNVRRFHGEVITVKVYQDNTGVKEALARAQPGQVLVVDGGASLHCALLGDNLASKGIERGLRGIVIHGAIRDARQMADLGIGVLALGTNPRRSGDGAPSDQDVPVAIGGVVFRPGMYVYIDEDAVVACDQPVHGS
jgi:regulator of ribonuclease activity A